MPDEPRLLARRSELSYTDSPSQALRREPEAISEWDQNAYSVQARAAFAEQREAEINKRDRRMWADRWRKAEQRADARGVDIYRFEIQVRQAVTGMEEAIEQTTP